MTAHRDGRVIILTCDRDECDWRFQGEPGVRTPTVRGHARAHDWACDNPGPGKPARDLCPRHRLGRPRLSRAPRREADT